MLPVTVSDVNVPTLVIFACAAALTVAAWPVVLALNVPIILDPGIDVSPDPDPVNCTPVTVPAALISPSEIKLAPVILPVA